MKYAKRLSNDVDSHGLSSRAGSASQSLHSSRGTKGSSATEPPAGRGGRALPPPSAARRPSHRP
jgi:hypothetical protein